MRRWVWVLMLPALAAGCGADPAQEREALLATDREWSQSVRDTEKFLSYFAADATVYAPGSPAVTGPAAIRDMWSAMSSAPGFSIEWTPGKADVSGDIGYTTGTYKGTTGGATEAGKYVTVWKKQSDGSWKAVEDIFNADAGPGAGAPHVMLAPDKLTWTDAPPTLPPGAKLAVISGDPAGQGPFVVRLQLPAKYTVAAHWHPTDESVTVLSGTVAHGMGDKFDEKALQNAGAGGFVSIPAKMNHFAMARTAATIQVHGVGPFVINYVNPEDDPGRKP